MAANVRRVVVLGGLGLFGRTAIEQLATLGVAAHTASRRAGADIRVDANDARALRSALRPGDVVLDVAGPFHRRTMALIDVAIDIGFDVVDVNDNLDYAERIALHEPAIAAAGIRVCSSASSVSAVSAGVVDRSRLTAPSRVTVLLMPASRYTANVGSARSLIESVGRPVRIWRGGRFQTLPGWSESRRMALPPPLGSACGRLFESADAFWLPRIWPTLADVTMYVDANAPGVNALLRLAGRAALVRRLLAAQVPWATWVARRFGSAQGGIGYEVVDAAGRAARYALVADRPAVKTFVTAVAPAVLAVAAMLRGEVGPRGLLPPGQQIASAELFDFLAARGIRCVEFPSAESS